MFSEFVEARVGEAERKGWAIAVSVFFQMTALLALLLVPLVYTQALPIWVIFRGSVTAPVPFVDAPKPPKVLSQYVRPAKRLLADGVIYEPKGFLVKSLVFVDPALAPEMPVNGTDFRVGDLVEHLTNVRNEAEPPPVAPPSVPAVSRISQSDIQPAMILAQPQPVYPPLARSVRIQGDVLLHAIIDREGRVAALEVVSGHPLLVKAALAAVVTWRYRPTMLNGKPVEVETTIRVSFVLGR